MLLNKADSTELTRVPVAGDEIALAGADGEMRLFEVTRVLYKGQTPTEYDADNATD